MSDIIRINKATPEEFLDHDDFIPGTPTGGEGQQPGQSAAWEENRAGSLRRRGEISLHGRTVALFGLGDPPLYSHECVEAMAERNVSVAERSSATAHELESVSSELVATMKQYRYE